MIPEGSKTISSHIDQGTFTEAMIASWSEGTELSFDRHLIEIHKIYLSPQGSFDMHESSNTFTSTHVPSNNRIAPSHNRSLAKPSQKIAAEVLVPVRPLPAPGLGPRKPFIPQVAKILPTKSASAAPAWSNSQLADASGQTQQSSSQSQSQSQSQHPS